FGIDAECLQWRRFARLGPVPLEESFAITRPFGGVHLRPGQPPWLASLVHEHIQLLIEPRRTLPHSAFSQLLKPMLPLFYLIDSRASCRNAATTIERFNPQHRSPGVGRKGFVGPYHFLQPTRRLPSVPDRTNHTGPQLRQLPSIGFVSLRSLT